MKESKKYVCPNCGEITSYPFECENCGFAVDDEIPFATTENVNKDFEPFHYF